MHCTKHEKYIEAAKKLAYAGKLDQSLEFLYKANNIHEDYYVNVLIVIILYQKDVKALIYLEKAYNSYPYVGGKLIKRSSERY